MTTATVHQAKTHLSRLIEQALAGEEVIIARGQVPVVRLVPVVAVPRRRELGGWNGVFRMAEDFDRTPDAFDDYMPQ